MQESGWTGEDAYPTDTLWARRADDAVISSAWRRGFGANFASGGFFGRVLEEFPGSIEVELVRQQGFDLGG
jgi:hypothetical protein